jgi:hypothetical protein
MQKVNESMYSRFSAYNLVVALSLSLYLAYLLSRKGESSDYGGSSEHHNHGVRYISHQFFSLLIIPWYLFFSAP